MAGRMPMHAPRGSRFSQAAPYANIRTALDRSAGRTLIPAG